MSCSVHRVLFAILIALSTGMTSPHCDTACFVHPASLATAVEDPYSAINLDFVIKGVMSMLQVQRTLLTKSTTLHLMASSLDYMQSVADRIKLLRKHLRLTQSGLGAKAGCSKSAVSQWERGVTEPERDSLLTLEKTARVNPRWVTHGTGEMFLKTHDKQDEGRQGETHEATNDRDIDADMLTVGEILWLDLYRALDEIDMAALKCAGLMLRSRKRQD